MNVVDLKKKTLFKLQFFFFLNIHKLFFKTKNFFHLDIKNLIRKFTCKILMNSEVIEKYCVQFFQLLETLFLTLSLIGSFFSLLGILLTTTICLVGLKKYMAQRSRKIYNNICLFFCKLTFSILPWRNCYRSCNAK